MVSLSSRSSSSFSDRIVQLLSDSLWMRMAVAAAFVCLVVLNWPDDGTNLSTSIHEDYHKYGFNANSLCKDPLWKTKSDRCECSNPLASAKRKSPRQWSTHHDKLVHLARQAKHEALDFVIVGDSITEGMMGTRSMGRKPAPELGKVFREVFDKSSGGKLQGLALGSSGDTSPELLYHLEHGMLPKSLNPRLWVVLIGTNDLGRSCSKEAALAGILHTAQVLHSVRPKTPIVIHGLLPRNDIYGAADIDYSLDARWKQILWINREIKKFCELHEEWYFVENGGLFLLRQEGRDSTGGLDINPGLMEDALHPTIEGYQKWLTVLSGQLMKILSGH